MNISGSEVNASCHFLDHFNIATFAFGSKERAQFPKFGNDMESLSKVSALLDTSRYYWVSCLALQLINPFSTRLDSRGGPIYKQFTAHKLENFLQRDPFRID